MIYSDKYFKCLITLLFSPVFFQVVQKLAKSTGILTAIRRVCGRDAFTLIMDIAGFLPDLLAPKLRTVPSHLYSSKEKADLARIINVMLDFGLSFVQEKNPQGGYIYNLDPYVATMIQRLIMHIYISVLY